MCFQSVNLLHLSARSYTKEVDFWSSEVLSTFPGFPGADEAFSWCAKHVTWRLRTPSHRRVDQWSHLPSSKRYIGYWRYGQHLLIQLNMSNSFEKPSGNCTPSDEGDVESLAVSLSTSPRKLIKVGLESEFSILLLNLTHTTVINRLSDSFKLRNAQQRHTAELSVVNSRMSRMAYQIAPSPNPNDPRSLMHRTNLVKKLMISIMLNTLSSRLGTSFV